MCFSLVTLSSVPRIPVKNLKALQEKIVFPPLQFLVPMKRWPGQPIHSGPCRQGPGETSRRLRRVQILTKVSSLGSLPLVLREGEVRMLSLPFKFKLEAEKYL